MKEMQGAVSGNSRGNVYSMGFKGLFHEKVAYTQGSKTVDGKKCGKAKSDDFVPRHPWASVLNEENAE